jgi:hypothetical protein
MDYRRSFALGLLAAPLALASAPASAAVWGSFTSSRIAYVTGPLTGDVHSMLRGYITDHGDTLADPTNELSPEYLAEVDVFYIPRRAPSGRSRSTSKPRSPSSSRAAAP